MKRKIPRGASPAPGAGAGRTSPGKSQPAPPPAAAPAPAPEDPDEALLTSIARAVVRRGLAAPAVFFLESSKPLSFIGSQALVFFEPFVKAFLDLKSYDRFTSLMEDRRNVERLIRKVEDLEDERERAEKEAKAARRAEQGETRSRWQFWRRKGS